MLADIKRRQKPLIDSTTAAEYRKWVAVGERAAELVDEAIDTDLPDEESDEQQTCPDGMPVKPYDPDILTLPNPPTHMLPKKDERSLRYSPDQARRPNGEFGEGDGTSKGKTAKPLSVKEAKAELKKNAFDWQALPEKYSDEKAMAMYEKFIQMKEDAEAAIKEGRPETNAITSLIQSQTLKEDTLYRGMVLSPKEAAEMFKTGTDIQIFPCSFSKSSDIADEFANGLTSGGRQSSKVAVILSMSTERGRVHGIDLEKYDRRCAGFQEVISGGHVKVAGVLKTGSKMFVNLYQTAAF